MSLFTTFFNTVINLDEASAQLTTAIDAAEAGTAAHLKLLVQGSLCYAHIQLQKGLAFAEEALLIADARKDEIMKAYALCCKAKNQARIGYIIEARLNGKTALDIFERLKHEEGMCDASWVLGNMIEFVPNIETQLYLKQALAGYSQLNDATGIYLARIQNTTISLSQLKFDEAFDLQMALLEELAAPEQVQLRSYLYMEICRGLLLRHDIPRTITYMEQWMELATGCGNFHDYARSKSLLTDVYRVQKIDKAVMQHCLEAMECCHKLGCLEGVTTMLLILANICFDQGEYADALKHYLQADEIAAPLLASFKHLYALNGAGLSLIKLKEFEQAQPILERALEEAIVSNDPVHVVMSHRNLAELAIERGQFDDALLSYKRLFDTADSAALRVRDHGQYAQLIAKASEPCLLKADIKINERTKVRLQYLRSHLEAAQLQVNKREEANAYNALAVYYEELNDLKLSLYYHKLYQAFYEELVAEQNTNTLAALRMQYETEKKDQQIALLKKESEQALLTERLRISRDLHDDIGATLSSISVYSTAVKQRLQNDQQADAEVMLDRISEDAQEMVNNISDMVWMINPKNDSTAKLLERIQSSAEQLLFSRNISLKLHFDAAVKDIYLSIEDRKSIYLLIREAVNNAAKHAACSEVSVEIKKNAEELHIAIIDNGIGFNPHNAANNGNGLNNMKLRSELLNGIMKIETAKGTSIRFRGPIPTIREKLPTV